MDSRRYETLKKSSAFGFLIGTLVTTILSVAMTLWNWIENPGGIFRGVEGTHWKFVWDTVLSWFWPAAIYVVIIVGIAHFIYLGIYKRRTDT